MSKQTPPPPGWGNDNLSKFMQAAYENSYTTFFKFPDLYARLRRIDDIFEKAGTLLEKGYLKPQLLRTV